MRSYNVDWILDHVEFLPHVTVVYWYCIIDVRHSTLLCDIALII